MKTAFPDPGRHLKSRTPNRLICIFSAPEFQRHPIDAGFTTGSMYSLVGTWFGCKLASLGQRSRSDEVRLKWGTESRRCGNMNEQDRQRFEWLRQGPCVPSLYVRDYYGFRWPPEDELCHDFEAWAAQRARRPRCREGWISRYEIAAFMQQKAVVPAKWMGARLGMTGASLDELLNRLPDLGLRSQRYLVYPNFLGLISFFSMKAKFIRCGSRFPSTCTVFNVLISKSGTNRSRNSSSDEKYSIVPSSVRLVCPVPPNPASCSLKQTDRYFPPGASNRHTVSA